MVGARGNNGGAPDFEEFVQACGPRLLRVAWLLTADAHLAEDLLQTALAKVWPKWRRIATEHPEAYVRKTMVNTHASWWQRRWRSEVPHAELPDRVAGGDPFAGVDLEQALAAAVRQLPSRQRAVLVLRYFEDLSVEETAETLRCRPGTVKSQSGKALRTLRALLGDTPFLSSDGPESRRGPQAALSRIGGRPHA
ncbi:SigE family RNA polymerase sigma factor [Kitasatospora sp. DSM 101779]|uniref:SigE family RNA polymerase sigma factor n=1 Tax=Kitasatospora sp. DSM 101779 TaxID=2853165 RepID=UPI0021DB0CEE|nr:SigE family RNA polymerase sigma factor [Kitasatospora sp. DSM 101779]MCU7827247.1 SigE family RNA polymerase sigma factor [Kitasatospora sp. DSM 101779]